MMGHDTRDLRDSTLCTWFAFWAQFVVLGAAAVLGAGFAGADIEPGDQTCGLILIVSACLLMFLRLKAWFDTGTTGWSGSLLVADMANLVAVTVVFIGLALAGIVIGASVSHGGLHSAGVALVLTSALGIFLSLKNVFDIRERHI
ncbi:MAG: hypothetical protein JO001_28150 [Alphaproteobacteria bacterium]|nr:hypothetical protein [Alphaproteobacteria bacterium]